MKIFRKHTAILCFFLLIAFITHAQKFNNILNAPTKAEIQKSTLSDIFEGGTTPYGIKTTGVLSPSISNLSSGVLMANQDIIIQYDIPGLVVIDRLLFGIALRNKLAELLDRQSFWAGFANMSESDKQNIVNLIQQDIDKFQGLYDELTMNCTYVNFNDYSTRVNADVRYNDPISGSLRLLRSDLGVADFTNIPYSQIEGNPVKATIQIYKK